MADSRDSEAAILLQRRLLEGHPDWGEHLHLDHSSQIPMLSLPVPNHPGHRLVIDVSSSEATVSYDDGRPPGPAEALFIWASEPVANGVDAVSQYVEAVVNGTVPLVRERLPSFARLLRRYDCESLLRFVQARDLEGWSPWRRRRILEVWSWEKEGTLAI